MNHRIFLLASLLWSPISLVNAQQAADGLIVPFTSDLPACASQCGKLFDVQGACTPPVLSSTDTGCFCSDTRLTPILQGTAGVSSVCGATSCTATSDLTAIETWYKSYCGTNTQASATASGGSASSTGTSSGVKSSNQNNSWIATHFQWVIMLVVLIFGIAGLWIAAIFIRRRYIRKKEREYELRPPVALGPHHMQAMTGGHSYGDGIENAGLGGHHKEANRFMATPANNKRESRGWLTKARR